jgi:hypothetical protein
MSQTSVALSEVHGTTEQRYLKANYRPAGMLVNLLTPNDLERRRPESPLTPNDL